MRSRIHVRIDLEVQQGTDFVPVETFDRVSLAQSGNAAYSLFGDLLLHVVRDRAELWQEPSVPESK